MAHSRLAGVIGPVFAIGLQCIISESPARAAAKIILSGIRLGGYITIGTGTEDMELGTHAMMEDANNTANRAAPEGEQFETLITEHIGWIYSMARRHLGDSGLADDATQAVLLALWRKRGSLKKPLGGLLVRAIRYACNDIRRSEQRRKVRERKVAAMRNEEAPGSADGAKDSQLEHLQAMDAALQRLSTADRNVVVARYFQNQSARQMAEQLHISETAAEKRTSRAVEKLRLMMARKGIPMDSLAVTGLLALGAGSAPAGLAVRIFQAINGKAPVSPTASHAARSIAFHNAHVPAIAGAGAVAVALAIGVAALAPIQRVVEIGPGVARTISGALTSGDGVDRPACAEYVALVDRGFAMALRRSGKLIATDPGGIQTYNIQASTLRTILTSPQGAGQPTLGHWVHWAVYRQQFPHPGYLIANNLSRQFPRPPAYPTAYINLFPTIRGQLRANLIRLHLSFLKNSSMSVFESLPKGEQQPPVIPYVYNRNLNIHAGRAVVLLQRAISFPGDKWYSAVVLEVEKYPTEELGMLRRGGYLDLPFYLREGPAALKKLAAVAVAWHRFAVGQQAVPTWKSKRWVKSLPGDVQVALHGIGSDAWPLCAWAPDGRPRASGGASLGGNLPAGDVRVSLWIKLPVKRAGAVPADEMSNGFVTQTTSAYLKRSVLHVGFDTGPWKIIGPAKPTKDIAPQTAPKFLFQGKNFGAYQLTRNAANPIPLLGTPASVSMMLLRPQSAGFPRQAIAVGAIDRKGHLVAPYPGYLPDHYASSAFSRFQTSRSGATGEYATETIPVSANNIKRYVWITRPRYWVTFRNFALKPTPLPSEVFAMSMHPQNSAPVSTVAAMSPTTKPGKISSAGRATPAQLIQLMTRQTEFGSFTAMDQLYWAPTTLEKHLAWRLNKATAAMFGYGLWLVAKKRFGLAQLHAAHLTRATLGWPVGPQQPSRPIRWQVNGRFAAPIQTPGQINVIEFSPSRRAPLIREHGVWYINFSTTPAKLRQVQKQLAKFKQFFPHAQAYKTVLAQLKSGKIKDVTALHNALDAALKSHSNPGK